MKAQARQPCPLTRKPTHHQGAQHSPQGQTDRAASRQVHPGWGKRSETQPVGCELGPLVPPSPEPPVPSPSESWGHGTEHPVCPLLLSLGPGAGPA